MDNFNKIVSFVLGLVVVIVFLAVITGRLNLRSRIISGGKISPSPSLSVVPTHPYPSTTVMGQNPQPTNSYSSKPITTIPSTGSPTLLLPLLFSGAASGFFLKKAGKKN